MERVRATLAALGTPTALADRLAQLHALSGAAGIAALAGDLNVDESAAANAYTRLGEALGLDWAKGAAATLTPADSWERMLAASLVRGFETMRLAQIRAITPPGADPLAATEAWLAQADTAPLTRAIAAARASGTPPCPCSPTSTSSPGPP